MDHARKPPPARTRWNWRKTIIFAVLLFLLELGAFACGMLDPLGATVGRIGELAVVTGAEFALLGIALTILISPGRKHPSSGESPAQGRSGFAAALTIGSGIAGIFALGPVRDWGIRTGGEQGIGLAPFRELQQSPAVTAITSRKDASPADVPPDQWPASLGALPVRPEFIRVTPHPDGPPAIILTFGRGARFHRIYLQKAMPDVSDSEIVRWADDVWLTRQYGE